MRVERQGGATRAGQWMETHARKDRCSGWSVWWLSLWERRMACRISHLRCTHQPDIPPSSPVTPPLLALSGHCLPSRGACCQRRCCYSIV